MSSATHGGGSQGVWPEPPDSTLCRGNPVAQPVPPESTQLRRSVAKLVHPKAAAVRLTQHAALAPARLIGAPKRQCIPSAVWRCPWRFADAMATGHL